ncbi:MULTISPECIES: DUF3040 domain-containing protein [unclassified Tessaracoccus]|uniref:DUF3040 domain-containing protein n=1 Tax=unclassified Tessaracoccus TaxID=2635419 RepID=UPI001601FE95|nr:MULTISPECIES: DUF3040 domain-containing protein [unclassified Tessaracoccus]MBB1512624.1 DUF3040 domain-containing protein [Tessaracoccus sp. MC1627]MBB1516495.1 DUF3040 domain-containing protein [Tessaracoccus sp. MC1679]
MALSEQERKLLEQLEASLMAEDPKLADTLSGSSTIRIHRRRAAIAGVGFIAGVVVLLVGVQVHPAVSVLGFLLMLGAALIGINSWRRVGDEGAQPSRRGPSAPRPSPSTNPSQDFMDKLEERWRRRQQGDL